MDTSRDNATFCLHRAFLCVEPQPSAVNWPSSRQIHNNSNRCLQGVRTVSLRQTAAR